MKNQGRINIEIVNNGYIIEYYDEGKLIKHIFDNKDELIKLVVSLIEETYKE